MKDHTSQHLNTKSVGPRSGAITSRAVKWIAVAIVGIASVAVGLSQHASASPGEAVVQQVTIIPHAGGIEIDVELAVGASVAAEFVAMVDADGDAVINDAEWAELQRAVLDDVTIELDGRSIAPTILEAEYPPIEPLKLGRGVVRFTLDIDATDQLTMDGLSVVNAYAPVSYSGPIATSVQIDLAPDVDWPIAVGPSLRSEDGRQMVVSFVASEPSTAATSNRDANSFENRQEQTRRRFRSLRRLAKFGALFVLVLWRWLYQGRRRRSRHRGA